MGLRVSVASILQKCEGCCIHVVVTVERPLHMYVVERIMGVSVCFKRNYMVAFGTN